jgi:outer membrane protein TolC
MDPFRRLAGCLLALPLIATPARSEETASPEETAADTAVETPAESPSLHGELRLSLDEAIRMGLENNLDVEVERHGPLIAEEDESIAWGAYDPELYSEFGYSDIEDPNAFRLNSNAISIQKLYDGEGGFRGRLPWLGSRYQAGFGSQRLATSSTIQALSPEYRSSFELSLVQPILRNLIWNPEWTAIKTSAIALDSARDQFRSEVMNTVRAIEAGYWQLIEAQEQLRVAEKSLETARALLDQARTQLEVGVVSKVAVAEAEAGVAEREFNRILAANRYRTQQDQLIDLVLGPHLAARSTLEIAPSERPENYVPFAVDVEQSLDQALAHRPELALAQQEIERQELQLAFARNQRLPALDLSASYGNRGLAGRGNPNLNPAFGTPPADTSYSDSLEDLLTDDAPEQFSARATLSFPIPNTAPRHRVSKSELELRRAITRQRQTQERIVLEVRKATRDLESAHDGIAAAERRRLATEEQLRAERIRLQYGESTPFDVLQRERDLVDAEVQKIAALRAYRVSAVDLDRAQGTILRNRNIAIEEVSALRPN